MSMLVESAVEAVVMEVEEQVQTTAEPPLVVDKEWRGWSVTPSGRGWVWMVRAGCWRS